MWDQTKCGEMKSDGMTIVFTTMDGS
jgi:hypothetical protein